jgi:hypothetical protein
MKLNAYNILRNDREMEDMLNEMSDILNLGLYQENVLTAVPTYSAQEGESTLYYSGTDKRLYKYINGSWSFIPLRDEACGWGYIAETANPSVTKAVSFGTAFSAAPLIFVSYIGSRLISAGTPTGPAWFTGALTLRIAIGYAASTTGFTAGIIQTAGANLDNAYNSGFVYRAMIT